MTGPLSTARHALAARMHGHRDWNAGEPLFCGGVRIATVRPDGSFIPRPLHTPVSSPESGALRQAESDRVPRRGSDPAYPPAAFSCPARRPA